MKQTLLVLAILCGILTSCGVSKDAATSRDEGIIQSTFFGQPFGSSRVAVYKKIDIFPYNRPTLPSVALMPVESWRIKSNMTDRNVAFGGYSWSYASFLFDYKDRFFCIAFVQDYSELASATERFNEIKGLLDGKYGAGESTGDTVQYGTPNGRYAILSIAPWKNKWCCTLHYIDEELYRKDTQEAQTEL